MNPVQVVEQAAQEEGAQRHSLIVRETGSKRKYKRADTLRGEVWKDKVGEKVHEKARQVQGLAIMGPSDELRGKARGDRLRRLEVLEEETYPVPPRGFARIGQGPACPICLEVRPSLFGFSKGCAEGLHVSGLVRGQVIKIQEPADASA